MLLNPDSNQHLISVRQGKDPHNGVVNKLHTYRIRHPKTSVCRLILNSHPHSIILLYRSTIRRGADKSSAHVLWIFHSILFALPFLCDSWNHSWNTSFLCRKGQKISVRFRATYFGADFLCLSCLLETSSKFIAASRISGFSRKKYFSGQNGRVG